MIRRRTFADVAGEAVEGERAAVLAHLKAKYDAVEGLIAKGRLTALEGSMLRRSFGAAREEIEMGLHRG